MSGVVNTFWEGAADIWNGVVGDRVKEVGISNTLDKGPERRAAARRAAEANRPRRAPSLDDARAGQLESDRQRRRKGVLANIYGGASGGAPTVGVKTLLGQ